MAQLFNPIKLRALELKNRIMVSPMCQYQAGADAVATDWHFVHYGSLALGGAALLMVESTAVEARGRITERDLGIYSDIHTEGLKRIVDFAHNQGIRVGIQLGHAGRKADVSSDIVAPSCVEFSDQYKRPHAVTLEQVEEIIEAFRVAARRAVEAGFDTIELHMAHGYLLHQFLSPLSNRRTDEYGGSRENRIKLPLEVVKVVRSAMPQTMPLFVRISGSEYSAEGYSLEDVVYYSTELKRAGVDLIDVSSGGNIPARPPHVFAGYQVPLAAAVRAGADIAVCAVGHLEDPVLANSVVSEGRADMVAIARGFLRDKHWAHQAARQLGVEVNPPVPYARAY